MSNDLGHSVAGGWLGTYYYGGLAGRMPPVRFEATFTAGAKGHLSGAILDDGPGGEARATGMQSGREIVFTKVYVAPVRGHAKPVEYSGTVAEDGRTMRGTWRIKTVSGTWEAHRLWSEDAQEEPLRHTEGWETARAGA